MENVFKRLKLGTFAICGFGLVLYGAAGHAVFADATTQCPKPLTLDDIEIIIPNERRP